MTATARQIDEVVYSESLSDEEKMQALKELVAQLVGDPLHPYALSSVAHVAFTDLNDTGRGIDAIATLASLYSHRDVVAEVALSLEGMLEITNPAARAALVRTIEPYVKEFREDYRRLWLERTKTSE